jgi:glutaredoxin 3
VYNYFEMTITIYSTTTCPYCKMLKDYLTQKGVGFTEKLTDQDQKIQEEMVALSSGFMGVPFTVIQKDDGTIEKVVGFDKSKIDAIIGLS